MNNDSAGQVQTANRAGISQADVQPVGTWAKLYAGQMQLIIRIRVFQRH